MTDAATFLTAHASAILIVLYLAIPGFLVRGLFWALLRHLNRHGSTHQHPSRDSMRGGGDLNHDRSNAR